MAEHPFALETFFRLQIDFFTSGRHVAPLPDYRGLRVLMLHADDDRVTPWALNGQRLASRIPDVANARIHGGSHWLHL